MDQRDPHAVLVELPAEIGMYHHHTDAANGAGAGQEDALGLGSQRIACRKGMFSDKGPTCLLPRMARMRSARSKIPATSPPKLSISNAMPRTAGSLAAASICAAIPS